MIDIKPLKEHDWPLLKAVRLRTLADAPEAFTTTLAQARAWDDAEWQARARRFNLDPPASAFVAFFDAAPCGIVCCYVADAPEEDLGGLTADLTSFWVAPELRGQGVGDTLLASASQWAVAQGVQTLQAWVVDNNSRALGFYLKSGFLTTARSEPYAHDPARQVIMLSKPLDPRKQERVLGII